MSGDEAPRRFLIATAVARHLHAPQWDLPGLVDAHGRIVELFTGTLGYRHVDDLGLNPTKNELTTRLRAFCRAPQRRGDDLVAVYLAGHGEVLVGSEEHVLVTADTDPEDLAGALPTAELARQVLLNTPVRRLLLMLDTCYSGQGGNELTAAALTGMTRHWEGEPGTGIVVISSAQPAEQAKVGAFPQLLSAAVANVSTAGHAPRTLPVDTVVKVMNADRARPGHQTIGSTMIGLTGEVPPFLPNPRQDARQTGVDLAIQHAVEWETETSRQDDAYRATLLVRAKGGPDDGAAHGWWFSGRTAALREITRWLAEPEPARPLLAVTAAPGSGKTAVLGLVATLTHPERRATVPVDAIGLPSDAVPAAGAVDVVLYAQNLTADQVVRGIAAGVRVRAETPGELLDALPGPVTVLVDALDEAADPHDLVRRVLRPLADHSAGRLRLLVGTRPHLLADLELSRETSIDLDAPRYSDLDALTAYAARGLRESVATSPYRDRPKETAAVASAVARAADPSFLVARVLSGTLAADTEVADWQDPTWVRTLPRLPGEAMRHDLTTRLGDDATRVQDLLRPLAFAGGLGLPWEDIWAPLATRMAGRTTMAEYTDEDLLWLRRNAGSYVVETVEAERSAYRLYHQALAEHLRAGVDAAEVHDAFTDVLLSRVPVEATGGRRWARAHPYALRHLATHASRCGRLDPLLADPGYLAHAEPDGLLPALGHVAGADARLVRSVYRASAGHHRRLPPERRRLVLATDALRFGATEPHRALAAPLRWVPRWATGQQASAALRATFTDHERPVTASACAVVDGRPVAVTTGHDRTVRVWDLETTTLRATMHGHRGVVHAVACADVRGRPVAVTVASEPGVRVWDLITGEPRATLITPQDGTPTTVACTVLTGRTVAVVGGHGRLEVWDLATAEHVATFGSSADAVDCAIVGGRPLAVLAEGTALVTIDLVTGERRRIVGSVIDGRKYHAVTCTVLDGRTVVLTGDSGGGARVLDLVTGEELVSFVGHEFTVTSVDRAMVGGVPVAVTGGIDGSVRVWDLATGEPRAILAGHGHFVSSVTCTVLSGQPSAVTTGLDGTVRVWDLTAPSTAGAPEAGHTADVNAAAITIVDGVPLVVTGGGDGTVRVWDLGTGTLRATLTGHTMAVFGVACTVVDGRPVAVTCSFDETVRVWDLATSTSKYTFSGHRGPVRGVACTVVDGRPVAVSVGTFTEDLHMWWLDSGVSRGVIDTRFPVAGVACASIDAWPVAVTVGALGGVLVWDLTHRYPVANLVGHDEAVEAVATGLLDGRPIAVTGGRDRTVQWWDLATSTRLGVCTHEHGVVAIALLDLDGAPAAAALDAGGAVRLWDLRTSAQLDVLDVSGMARGALCVGPAGELVIGSGWDVVVFDHATDARDRQ